MLTFMSLPNEQSADERAAKLKALQDYYHTTPATAFRMLPDTALSTANADRGDILVINAHGNAGVFAGFDADRFMHELNAKGLQNGAFKAIYLMACSVGKQAQDNSILDNFARHLKRSLVGHGIDVKLYAPRGVLTYTIHRDHTAGGDVIVVDDMYIRTPERNYPLDEGVLLVQ